MADTQQETFASDRHLDFSCRCSDLIYGMDIVKRTLGSGKNMPILSGVKMKIGEDALELTSTNLETSTLCKIPIDSSQPPETIVLKGDVLTKITQRLPDQGEVRFSSDPEESRKIELSYQGITYELFQLPTEDYPSVSNLPGETLCKVDKEAFREAINQSTFAALKSKEATRLSLTGVNTILKEGQLKLVATNGYRMALKTIPTLDGEGEETCLIEAGALSEWNRILSLIEEDEISIFASDSEVFFSAGEVVFSDKLIMEEFPEFEGVIPRDNDLPLQLDRGEFLETLRRAEITASEESGAVNLQAWEGKNELQISSSSSEKGEFSETVNLDQPSKGELTASFKGEFLIDALRRMKGESLTFWLADGDTAGLLEPSGKDEESDFIYVCMPISQQ
ncbi:MAG: DNA polymerase III subunit beta [Candidatus Bipolaricaulota bacterium]